jgi:tRNA 2-(methylsulfanyl)-N6-isopentenyladenosine37 hydroxylase
MTHSEQLIAPILGFLHCRTPDRWVEEAVKQLGIILNDHAANELKAAQSAMTLIARNPLKQDVLYKMSRLAREELVHFEQVLKIMKKRDIKLQTLKASSYAAKLFRHIRQSQDDALTDTLILGAIIEARSCERFEKLAPHLDADLEKFYVSLLKSEARHYEDYLDLAQKYSNQAIEERVQYFLALEKDAILTPDPLFRFHSGVPMPKYRHEVV